MSQATSCPVCQSTSTVEFLQRNQVPVHQNLVIQDKESALGVARGDLSLVACRECGFVFNQAFDLSKLSYGTDYDNTQNCSPSFDEYLNKLINYLIVEKKVQNCRVVEVGCGKGYFIKRLVEDEAFGNLGYGFDPSYVGPEIVLDGRLKFEKRYYGPDCASIQADVVICRHVIEHVPDPVELLRTIRLALVNSPQARVFFETPCVEWILQNQVIWDFFYEHCSYFTAQSLTTAFEVAGFKVEEVQHIFGGQYLWLEATLSTTEELTITKQPGAIIELAQQFANSQQQLKTSWQTRLQKLLSEGNLALWGAGAKGVTFANLLDPEGKLISCVVDLNPNKQGHYIPGTGHPIVDYRSLDTLQIANAILMNPNYREENSQLLQAANINARLIE